MGLRDRLGGGDDSKNEYTVVARKANGTGAPRPDEVEDGEWRWPQEPPTKDHFQFEYGEYLNSEFKYVCVEITKNGYDFEDPEWVIQPDGDTNPAAEAAGAVYQEMQDLKEQVEGESGEGVNLSDVESEDELQARLKGVVAERGLEVAENTDDVIRILDSIGTSREPVGHPMIDMMTDAQNNLEINSPMDMAMMMAMPELKDMMQSGQQLMGNLQQMTGGGQSAGASMAQQMMGGSQQQQPPQQNPQTQPSQTTQQGMGQQGAGTPTQSQPNQSPTSSQSQTGSSFSMDDMVDEEADGDDPEVEPGTPGEDDSPLSAAPDDVDDEPEAEMQEDSTDDVEPEENPVEEDTEDDVDDVDESSANEPTDDDNSTDEPEVTA
mgnify:CR=1 FL=1